MTLAYTTARKVRYRKGSPSNSSSTRAGKASIGTDWFEKSVMASDLNLHESSQFRSFTCSGRKFHDAIATCFSRIHVGIAIASTYGIDDHGVETVLI
jgi:hypothetical protein